jgi:Na+/H+ antiporter NhaD/arsenite permease-like protein
MFALIALVFIAGYASIALEHPLRVNKAASALLTGMVIWTLITVGQGTGGGYNGPVEEFTRHLSSIASILFFLLGAMVVVELMDAHAAFQVITDRITTTNKRSLLWIIGLVTFFLSAALDNMTTAIVMCALLRKLIRDRNDLWIFAGAVIIAANAGGAWSPIGDVTTIMLWIDGQVTSDNIIVKLLLPSLVCLILPLIWMSRTVKGNVDRPVTHDGQKSAVRSGQRLAVFLLGLITLLGVPVFKHFTHLPPFVGIMLGLGVLWVYTEFVHAGVEEEARGQLQVTGILRRVDHTSVLFFLGILIAVAGLETSGHLAFLANGLTATFGDNIYAVNTILGFLSAIVDNVPLVAAAQGMYPLSHFPQNHLFWELLAYCAGTGGSILVIGSTAGVSVMGMIGIEFGWYAKRIAFPAALGYVGGILAFWVLWH